MSDKKGTVYCATCQINKKKYIGQTRGKFKYRIRAHITRSSSRYSIFHDALEEHGSENFLWEVLEECPTEELNAREIFYIKDMNTLFPNGYNLSPGGTTSFGTKGEEHWLRRKSKEDYDEWILSHRTGKQNGM